MGMRGTVLGEERRRERILIGRAPNRLTCQRDSRWTSCAGFINPIRRAPRPLKRIKIGGKEQRATTVGNANDR
jgi:hypothetical protein